MIRPARLPVLRTVIAFAVMVTLGLQGMLLATKAGLAAGPQMDALRVLCLGAGGHGEVPQDAADHGGSLSCLAACLQAASAAGPAPLPAVAAVERVASAAPWATASPSPAIPVRPSGAAGPRGPPVSA